MNGIDIGDTITATHKGQEVRGRIVGREPSEYLRGWPTTGLVLMVDTGNGEWVKVHSSAVVSQEQPA